jgi:hypothetical protein
MLEHASSRLDPTGIVAIGFTGNLDEAAAGGNIRRAPTPAPRAARQPKINRATTEN